jgi:uncharacterized protein YxjI
LVKEYVGLFKAANNFDIYNPSTGEVIMECREPSLGLFTKLLRFTRFKTHTPFDIQIETPDGQSIVRIHRGFFIRFPFKWFGSKIIISDNNNNPIGGFRQKRFSIVDAFDVVDKNNQVICQVKGKLIGWDFYFKKDTKELAHVSKKWAGIGKEFFTSADNYILEISNDVPQNDDVRKLILSSVICIDMIYNE